MIEKILRSMPLFTALDDEEVARVAKVCTLGAFPQGTALFKFGEPSASFYVVASGRVRIRIPAHEGAPERTVSLGQGKFFGEMGVIRGTPRMADATVEESAELVTVLAEDFDQLMAVDTAVSEKIMAAYMARVAELEESKKETGGSAKDPHILLFIGVGGGAGASLAAASTALKIRDLTKKSVLAIDLDHEAPVLHHFMGFNKPTGGIRAVFGAPQITPASIKGAARRLDNGTELLGGPGAPDEGRVTPEVLGELVRNARKSYDYVVLDAASTIGPVNDALVRLADATHVVMGPDVLALSRALIHLKRYKEMGFDGRTRVLLNKVRRAGGLTAEQIAKDLGKEVMGNVEYDDATAMAALVAKAPVVTQSPRSGLAVGLARFARQAVSLPAGVGEGSKSFSIWNLFG